MKDLKVDKTYMEKKIYMTDLCEFAKSHANWINGIFMGMEDVHKFISWMVFVSLL